MLYYKYSDYLKEKYGEKVYKLPIHLPISCPNRENAGGGFKGCSYCAEIGAGFESVSGSFDIGFQIAGMKKKISAKYKAEKFIAFFQNYTNTYMNIETFKKCINEAVADGIVEISVSTRPDCVRKEYLDALKDVSEKHGVNITIELGLQTVNYHSLIKVNRGHTLAEFINASLIISRYGFNTCAHLILNLPWDDMDDVIESAKVLSALPVKFVKLHALYLIENTKMLNDYLNGDFVLHSAEDYVERVITFLEYLSPDIAVQRIIGRAPERFSKTANWNMSWWKIKEKIEGKMENEKRFQGKMFDYLNGKAVRKFF